MYKIQLLKEEKNFFCYAIFCSVYKMTAQEYFSVIVTFLAGYNFFLKLKAQIIEMVSLPVLQKHFSDSYLEYKQQGNLHHQQKRPKR